MSGPCTDGDPVAWLAAGLVILGALVLCSRAAAVAAPALARRIRRRRRAARPHRWRDHTALDRGGRQRAAVRHRWFPGLLALVGLAATTPGAAAQDGPDRHVGEAGNDTAGQAAAAGAVSTMRLERPARPARTWLPRAAAPVDGPAEVAAPAPVTVPVPAAPAPAVAGTWTVRPGDHLWAIAEDVVARHLGRPPTDGEVAPYWRALVEANRDRLIDRSNPDLILPGQEVVLPPA